MWLRTVCSWVINIAEKLTVSIFYSEERWMQVHRSIGKCLPLFMDISTLENETSGLSKRRIPTIPEGRGPLTAAGRSNILHVTACYKNSTGTEFNTFFRSQNTMLQRYWNFATLSLWHCKPHYQNRSRDGKEKYNTNDFTLCINSCQQQGSRFKFRQGLMGLTMSNIISFNQFTLWKASGYS